MPQASPPPPPAAQPPRFTAPNLWVLSIVLLTALWARDLWVNGTQVQAMPYSEFVQHLQAGNVASLRVSSSVIEGDLKKPLADGRQRFITARVEPALAKDLAATGVKFEGVVENNWLHELASWVLPVLLMFGLWNLLQRRMAKDRGFGLGGMLNVGKSRARVYAETEVKVRFDDVAGVDEAKAELLRHDRTRILQG